jgi:hypothetical protein
MTHSIYALLVGIDDYAPDSVIQVNQLQGCVNDITAIEVYLNERSDTEKYNLNLLTLKNKQATRDAVIDGFRNHLCQARNNDVVLFYYSGHGSQELAPEEFRHLEPDRLNETLVCYDSRTEGGWGLADKELAQLIAEVSEKKPHICIILDSCHSGSGTRDPLQETGVRLTSIDKRNRPLNSYLPELQQQIKNSFPNNIASFEDENYGYYIGTTTPSGGKSSKPPIVLPPYWKCLTSPPEARPTI